MKCTHYRSGWRCIVPSNKRRRKQSSFTLRHILSAELVKGQITVLDKIPNVDGDLENTNASQVPLGKIEVQVKALDKKDVLAPKYQCSREFLSYCELSILPVMLIVVDIDAVLTKHCLIRAEHIANFPQP